MGTLLRSSAVVHERIELSFGVVSGVGGGMGVLEGAVSMIFGICAPIGLFEWAE